MKKYFAEDIKKMYFPDQIFDILMYISHVCPQGYGWQQIHIDSGSGLAPNRRQTITWTNVNNTKMSDGASYGTTRREWLSTKFLDTEILQYL